MKKIESNLSAKKSKPKSKKRKIKILKALNE